jgi:hypothetical protein
MLLLVCFTALAFAEKKPKPQPVVYSNTKTFAGSCDTVWAKIVPVIAKNALVPEASDRLGGFMRLRYTRGDMRVTIFQGNREIDKFTVAKGRPGGGLYSLFRVNGGTLTVVETGDSCMVTVQMEFSGYKDPKESFGTSGWMGFQSNGYLEAVILENLRIDLGQ